MKTDFIAPICIAAPLRRSGTTLLQRLLCSSSNGLIYGEEIAQDLSMLTSLLNNKELIIRSGKHWRNEQLDNVLNGNVNDWIAGLMPEIDGYLEAYRNTILSLLKYPATFAKNNGRPIWGMKFPEWHPASLLEIQRLIPETKIIYLYRNLTDCVRSAKTIAMVQSLEEIHQFCLVGKQYLSLARERLTGEQVLFVPFEDLINNAERWIEKLEHFTGIDNMDREVLYTKINTYKNDQNLKPGKSYLIPAELTSTELSVVNSYT